MKTKYALITLVGLAFLVSLPAHAQENLEDWVEFIFAGGGSASTSVSGTSASISVDGTGGESFASRQKVFPNAFGMIANLNVSSSSGEGMLYIRKHVATLASGNRILAEIRLWRLSNGDKRIHFRVRERGSSGSFVNVIARGELGDFDGTWTEGQDILLAFAIIGNEIWFASSVTTGIAKIQPFATMTAAPDEVWELAAYASSGSGNSFSGTLSNVSMLP